MTYRIAGLDPAKFRRYFAMGEQHLRAAQAVRLTAGEGGGYPCRVSLEDAGAGETLVLVNFTSHDVPTPYRTAYAIYVRETAVEPAVYIDRLPPVLASRNLSLRAFGADDMVTSAQLVMAGEGDAAIRALFADPANRYIMAHYAAYGCFAARIERHGEDR